MHVCLSPSHFVTSLDFGRLWAQTPKDLINHAPLIWTQDSFYHLGQNCDLRLQGKNKAS